MLEMHYNTSTNLQPKSLLDIGGKFKKEGSFLSNEHLSMFEATRHSPHSTSTSTLSSSLGGSGGGGGGDNTGSILGGSENSIHHGTGSVNEWVADMQPFANGVDLGHLSAEKFNHGLDEWENFLSESGGNDQTIFRWIAGGVQEGSFGLKQLLQGGNINGFEGGVGFEDVHQSSGIQVIPTCFSPPSENDNNVSNNMLLDSLSPSPSESTLNCDNGKFGGLVSKSLGSNSSNDGNQQSPILAASVNNLSCPPAMGLQQQMQPHVENLEEKYQDYNPHVMVNQLPYAQSSLNVNYLNPFLHGSQPEKPPTKRHNPGSQFVNTNYELLLRKQKELPSMQQSMFGLGQHLNSVAGWYLPENGLMVPKQEMASGVRNQVSSIQQQDQQQQQQILYGQVYKAMELILTRNFTQAQGILARLNHQLSPSTKPFQRSSLYFKEALQQFLHMPNGTTSFPLRIPNPFDGMLKMSAYKAFSEASPLIQFMNFTSNQALLEAVEDADCIHIIDFDIGFGAQWSSFIQELPRRKRGPLSSLKLTAFVSPSTHHTIEINLMHGSLTQFANDVGINFELEVVNFDSFDPKFYPVSSLRSSDNEAIVVNLPIWSIESHLPLLPSLLCFIKQLSPKIVVSMERGCERFELPFPYHLLHALQYFEVLMDSLDAANMDPDSANKIERFLFQPQIESVVLGRLQSPDIMPSWRNLFASACFSPVGFSNFAEAQAECVMKRTRIRGFNVEKRQASLVLCWQHHELLTASAWKC